MVVIVSKTKMCYKHKFTWFYYFYFLVVANENTENLSNGQTSENLPQNYDSNISQSQTPVPPPRKVSFQIKIHCNINMLTITFSFLCLFLFSCIFSLHSFPYVEVFKAMHSYL